jgi:transposase-like protein
MKIEQPPTPDDLTLDQIMQQFNTDESARTYLESIRWPNGVVCPHCKNNEPKKIWPIQANKEKKVRAGLYQCGECNKQFTCTVGTIFEDSHIPLRKWLVAFYLNSSSKKGISSLQLQRILDLGSYRTALFMQHRIRHALRDLVFNDRLTGVVEVDETYVGAELRAENIKAIRCQIIKRLSFLFCNAVVKSARKSSSTLQGKIYATLSARTSSVQKRQRL